LSDFIEKASCMISWGIYIYKQNTHTHTYIYYYYYYNINIICTRSLCWIYGHAMMAMMAWLW
jgi:hypothetical protein